MDPNSEAKSDPESTPKSHPFLSNVGIETVDLYVGSTRTHYRVHKHILCTKIPYFNKMFNGGFSEASSNSAEFPEDSPESFDVLLEWAYSQYRPLRPLNRVSPGSVSSNWSAISFYLLMDKLCMPDLMNEAMDSLRQFSKDNDFLPSIKQVIYVYRRSLPSSKLRLYVLNSLLYAFSLNQEPDLTPLALMAGIVMNETDLTADFLTAVRDQVRGGPKSTNPSAGDGSIYHIHGEGIGCSCRTIRNKDEMDSSKKKKPVTRTTFLKKAGSQMVDIRVGKELRLFRVHKSLLCIRVPYFDKMFNSEFSESITNSAVLQEVNAEAFDVLVDWVYTNILPPDIGTWDPIEVYIVADRICLTELMDEVIDIIQARFPLISMDALIIYSRLPKGSKLRLLALDKITFEFYTVRWGNFILLAHVNAKNKEFALDFLTRIQSYVGRRAAISDPNKSHRFSQ
ncbi:hypothetical protein BHYA_0183g00190 [Botrytis hyacinthi]|uniref:BTB domain-containing protein n=1 Tax=Botrytis hyacinthi TaxID=278943 RepID=A0A4Z1GM21_9HELO|nr:hypothetical protein BHYA_0183g00190 [Botrytis hyacinthi]